MRESLLAFLFFFTPLAFAFPEANDTAVLKGTYKGTWGTSPHSVERKLGGYFEYGGSPRYFNYFEVRNSIQNSGWVIETFFPSTASIANLLNKCAAYGGTIENVVTNAGTFETCHIIEKKDADISNVWWGGVPFGIVKDMSYVKNITYDLILDSFTFGK